MSVQISFYLAFDYIILFEILQKGVKIFDFPVGSQTSSKVLIVSSFYLIMMSNLSERLNDMFCMVEITGVC